MIIYWLFIIREKIQFYHLHITRFSDALFSSSRAKLRGVTLFFDPLSLTIGFLLYFDSDSDSNFKIPI